MKKIISKLFIGLFIISTPLVNSTELQAGPFMDYLDCAQGCIDSYDQWTLRRSACAADCYVELISSPLDMIIDIF